MPTRTKSVGFVGVVCSPSRCSLTLALVEAEDATVATMECLESRTSDPVTGTDGRAGDLSCRGSWACHFTPASLPLPTAGTGCRPVISVSAALPCPSQSWSPLCGLRHLCYRVTGKKLPWNAPQRVTWTSLLPKARQRSGLPQGRSWLICLKPPGTEIVWPLGVSRGAYPLSWQRILGLLYFLNPPLSEWETLIRSPPHYLTPRLTSTVPAAMVALGWSRTGLSLPLVCWWAQNWMQKS